MFIDFALQLTVILVQEFGFIRDSRSKTTSTRKRTPPTTDATITVTSGSPGITWSINSVEIVIHNYCKVESAGLDCMGVSGTDIGGVKWFLKSIRVSSDSE